MVTTTEVRGGEGSAGFGEPFAPLPLTDWSETKETLHRFLQVVGKIRLAASTQRNHWWNVPFHLTGRGLTTRPMGQVDGNPIFTIDFDLVAHALLIDTLDGRQLSLPLAGESVAAFYRRVLAGLDHLGVRVEIDQPHPFDLPDLDRPFDQDTEHRGYDRAQVGRYWRLLSQVNLLLEEFAARFSGKVSPVHHFWHTMDIAHTRFGERRVEQPPEVSRVAREAYSREVISFGFWFGDDSVPEPAFYAYTAPEPSGLADEPLAPDAARWITRDGNGQLAVLTLDEARAEGDVRAAALRFYESAYQAGARRAGWDTEALACPGGITDPVRSAPEHG